MRSSPPGPTIRPRRASTEGGIYGSHRDSSAPDRGRCRVHVPWIESASGDAAVRRCLGFGYGYRHGLRGPVVQRSRGRSEGLQALAPRGEGRDRRWEDGRVRVAGRSNLAPKVGQEVTVLYDPLDPEGARIRSFMMLWALRSIFMVLGGLLLVPGVLLLLVLLLLFAL